MIRNFFVRPAFHFPNRDRAQARIVKRLQKLAEAFGNLGREVGSCLASGDLGQPMCGPGLVPFEKNRFSAHASGASLLAASGLAFVRRLSHREHDEDLPKVIAVVEPWKAALANAFAKAVKCRQGDVFLVGSQSRCRGQLAARQADKLGEIRFPESSCCVAFADLELIQPGCDGRRLIHCSAPHRCSSLSTSGAQSRQVVKVPHSASLAGGTAICGEELYVPAVGPTCKLESTRSCRARIDGKYSERLFRRAGTAFGETLKHGGGLVE